MVNDNPDYTALAKRINTGTDNPETSRALVVFNTTGEPLGGVAVFEASMTWPVNDLMPFVAVTDADGNAVASDIPDLAEGPDPKGREDHRLLAFQLRFAVSDVPARGWRTYLAFLAGDAAPDEVVSPDPEGLDVETPGLEVVETTRHGGDLPPNGTF
jgi:hypothetical protein